jgi:hypothetical protein
VDTNCHASQLELKTGVDFHLGLPANHSYDRAIMTVLFHLKHQSLPSGMHFSVT